MGQRAGGLDSPLRRGRTSHSIVPPVRIDFWSHPGRPWTWVTSRRLLDAAPTGTVYEITRDRTEGIQLP